MRNIGDDAFILPMPMTLLGSMHQGKPNFMALGWVMRVNYKPCMIAAAVHRSHASYADIVEAGEFSVCSPTRAQLVETDYVGLVSAGKTDKSEVFEVFHGELANAPLVKGASLCLECRLQTTVDLPTNSLFIGEVQAAWSEDRFLTDGKPDLEKMDAYLLSMPDNRYWAVGEVIGRAWHEGKAMKS